MSAIILNYRISYWTKMDGSAKQHHARIVSADSLDNAINQVRDSIPSGILYGIKSISFAK